MVYRKMKLGRPAGLSPEFVVPPEDGSY